MNTQESKFAFLKEQSRKNNQIIIKKESFQMVCMY